MEDEILDSPPARLDDLLELRGEIARLVSIVEKLQTGFSGRLDTAERCIGNLLGTVNQITREVESLKR